MGRCPACGRWHTLIEEVIAAETREAKVQRVQGAPKLLSLDDVSATDAPRLSTGIAEFDRVLGGGLVPGAFVLVGGDPGIGKSTLLLQACRSLAEAGKRVLYCSGEESLEQIAIRARRLGGIQGQFRLLSDTHYEVLAAALKAESWDILVVDSIQTLGTDDLPSAPGSVTQVRECASRLMEVAKRQNVCVFLIGHVTKDGSLAGPRVLEHLVDAVLTFEGERHHDMRMLRAVKNRFGSTQELGLFEMNEAGLTQVSAASEYFLSHRAAMGAGSCMTVCLEGTRPLLAELQSLVTPSHFGTPQRGSTGLDPYRLSVLYAVLEKRCGLSLYSHDVFVSVAGGLRLEEPSTDLATACAVASSLRNRPVPAGWVVFGEIGLGGQIRPGRMAELRLKEAARLGLTHALLAREDAKAIARLKKTGIECHFVDYVDEAFRELWAD